MTLWLAIDPPDKIAPDLDDVYERSCHGHSLTGARSYPKAGRAGHHIDVVGMRGGRAGGGEARPAPHTSSGERANRRRKSPKLGGMQAAKQLGTEPPHTRQ